RSRLAVKVSAGADRDGLLVSSARLLPRHSPGMPFITAAGIQADSLLVRVEGATPGTRVSLLGRRFLHDWAPGSALQPFAEPEGPLLVPGFSGNAYLEDIHLSDEMRYVLDRRAAGTYPGSL